jgi:hypothetical protein
VQATVPATIADGPRQLPVGGLQRSGSSPPVASRPEASGTSIDVDGRHRLVLSSFVTPPPPGASRPRVYAPVFYPNARRVDEAQAIEIGLGTSRADVNFELAPVAAVRISGQVTGSTSDAANMFLRLMPRGAEHLGFGSEVATTLVEADGRFTFLNVPAGAYTLVASSSVPSLGAAGGGMSDGAIPEGVNGPMSGVSVVYPPGLGISGAMWWRARAGADVWGRVPLEVGDADVAGLAVPLHPVATVSGRIVLDDSAPLNPGERRLVVILEPANGDPALGVIDAWTTAGDASFAFSVRGMQGGRYLLRTPLFSGWFTKSVTMGGVDVTDTGFDATSGRSYSDVVLTVTRAGARLSGSVTDRTGRPATLLVVVFPTDPKLWVDYGLTPHRLRSTESSGAGVYSINGLADGEYYVAAVPTSQSSLWPDPKFLAAVAAQATRVSLGARAPATQNLRVSEVVIR